MGEGSPQPQLAPSRFLVLSAELLRATVLAVLLLCSTANEAIAQPAGSSLEVLGPTGLASPDGFEIAIVRRDGASGGRSAATDATVRAEGGAVRPSGIGFFVVPSAGATEVRVRAEAPAKLRATATFRIGPPGARVALSLEPAQPVKGRERSALLRVRLGRGDGTADPDSAPPVLRANVGTIEALERVGPGEFQARYLLPATRYPEVAIIVALSAWPHPASVHGAFGHVLVPLATAIELPGRTEPNARMQLEIAGVGYGPVVSDAQGRFKLPIVVPPGHRFARGIAEDRAGNRRRTQIDLMLPPTDQLACVHNPTRLPADGAARARILCASSDPFGKPTRAARATLKATRGQLSAPRQTEEGVQEWIYTAPREVFGDDTLSASVRLPSGTSTEQLEVELVQGPADRVELTSPRSTVHRGAVVGFSVQIRDAFGKPRDDVVPEVTASEGEVTAVGKDGPARFSGSVRVPEAGPAGGSLDVTARAFGPLGTQPSELRAWIADGKLRAAFVDPAGWPVPGQPLSIRSRPSRTTEAPQTVDAADKIETSETSAGDLAIVELPLPGAPVTLRHRDWPGIERTVYPLEGGVFWPQGTPVSSATARITAQVAPPVPVNVRLELKSGEVRYWIEDAEGRRLAGRRVEVTLPGATPREVSTTASQRVEPLSAGAAGTVTVVDLATGVMAVAQVRK